MIKKAVTNSMFFIFFIIGLYLCKTSTGGFYGNDRELIGLPICVVSAVCIVIQRFLLLDTLLEQDDIDQKCSGYLLKYATINNVLMCFFGIVLLKLLLFDVFIIELSCAFVIFLYNVQFVIKRKEMLKSIVYLSVIVFVLSSVLCLQVDVLKLWQLMR